MEPDYFDKQIAELDSALMDEIMPDVVNGNIWKMDDETVEVILISIWEGYQQPEYAEYTSRTCMIKKVAGKWLPEDLQVAINTFIEQFNIMEEYDLDHIPRQYTINLFDTMSKYPEYNNVLLDLYNIVTDEKQSW